MSKTMKISRGSCSHHRTLVILETLGNRFTRIQSQPGSPQFFMSIGRKNIKGINTPAYQAKLILLKQGMKPGTVHPISASLGRCKEAKLAASQTAKIIKGHTSIVT